MEDANLELRKFSNPQEQEDSEASSPLPRQDSSNRSLIHASSSSTWHFDFIRKRLQSQTPISREERKKVKDWAFSALLDRTDEKKCEFGASKRDTLLSEKELDYTVNILRYKSRELIKGEFLIPIFEKARNTLFELMEELLLKQKIQKIRVKYHIPTLENTFRYLYKAKHLFRARAHVLKILRNLKKRAEVKKRILSILKQPVVLIQDQRQIEALLSLTRQHQQFSQIVERLVISLQRDHGFLKARFYFFGEDVLETVRTHAQEIKNTMREAVLR